MVAARNGGGQGTSSSPEGGEPSPGKTRDQQERDQQAVTVAPSRRVALWVAACAVAIVVGSLVGAFLSSISTRQYLSADQFVVRAGHIAAIELVIAVPCLIAVFWWARRSRSTGVPDELAAYRLLPVSAVDPADYVPLYDGATYVRRGDKGSWDVEASARGALRLAKAGADLQRLDVPLGICVYGSRMQGKTRLAWEAVVAELPEWTLLAWPHQFNHPWKPLVDRLVRSGSRVVIWLDELQTYTAPWEVAALDELFARLRTSGVHFVVVATCREAVAADGNSVVVLAADEANNQATSDANGPDEKAKTGGHQAPAPDKAGVSPSVKNASASAASVTSVASGGSSAPAATSRQPRAATSSSTASSTEGEGGASGSATSQQRGAGAQTSANTPDANWSDRDALSRDDEQTARESLEPLVRGLIPIRLADLSERELLQLRRLYRAKYRKDVVPPRDMQRPGAVMLDIDGMRLMYDGKVADKDPVFPPEGRYVLHGLKLLRLAGIYSYPASRVRMACSEFELTGEDPVWNSGYGAVKLKRFVRVKSVGAARRGSKLFARFRRRSAQRPVEEFVEPMSVVYLESVVHDHLTNLADVQRAWPTLRERLAGESDSEGLIYLGHTILTSPLGDLQRNLREAHDCFESALHGRVGGVRISDVPDAYAAALCGKGDALYAQAERKVEGAMAETFRQAADAYQEATKLHSTQHVPVRTLAYAYRGLGRAQVGVAAASESELTTWRADGAQTKASEQQARKSLGKAIEAYEQACALYRRSREVESSDDLADLYVTLASLHIRAARLELYAASASDLLDGARQGTPASHLRAAIASCEEVLHLNTRLGNPFMWAKAQEHLGEALRELASLVASSDALDLFEQAERAYRAAEGVYTPQTALDEWTSVQEELGVTLYNHAAALGPGEKARALTDNPVRLTIAAAPAEREKQAKLLQEAAEADELALRNAHRESMPLHWANLNYRLAFIYFSRARISMDEHRPAEAREFLETAKLHNDRAWTMDDFEHREDASKLRREIAALRSTLE